MVVALALSLAFLQAPFLHVHEAGRAERHVADSHKGLILHFHLPGQHQGLSLESEAGESARSLDWFKLKPEKAPELTAASTSPALLTAGLAVVRGAVRTGAPQGYAAPAAGKHPSRAPPA